MGLSTSEAKTGIEQQPEEATAVRLKALRRVKHEDVSENA
jgi:hypothetical protein